MRNGFLYALFALLFLAAVWFTFSNQSPQAFLDGLFVKSYKYSLTDSGITFASDVAPPGEVLLALSKKDSFVLVLRGESGQTALNSAMANALIEQQIVLAGHKKATTTVVMAFDKMNGSWINCQTDYGTAKQNVTITKEECGVLLAPSNSVVWEIQFPNPHITLPLFELSADRIVFFPKNIEDIVPATFLTLKTMYPDAEAIIGVANNTIGEQQTPSEITGNNASDSNANDLGTIAPQ